MTLVQRIIGAVMLLGAVILGALGYAHASISTTPVHDGTPTTQHHQP